MHRHRHTHRLTCMDTHRYTTCTQTHMHGHTDTHTDRHTDSHSDTQTYRLTFTDRPTQTHKHGHTHIHTCTHTCTHTERLPSSQNLKKKERRCGYILQRSKPPQSSCIKPIIYQCPSWFLELMGSAEFVWGPHTTVGRWWLRQAPSKASLCSHLAWWLADTIQPLHSAAPGFLKAWWL